jgi:hypothetical protein
MVAQRAGTAAWIVDQLNRLGVVRQDVSRNEAIDTVWVLMDPAVFDRLTRLRNWTPASYEQWIATSLARLLIGADDRSTTVSQQPVRDRKEESA